MEQTCQTYSDQGKTFQKQKKKQKKKNKRGQLAISECLRTHKKIFVRHFRRSHGLGRGEGFSKFFLDYHQTKTSNNADNFFLSKSLSTRLGTKSWERQVCPCNTYNQSTVGLRFKTAIPTKWRSWCVGDSRHMMDCLPLKGFNTVPWHLSLSHSSPNVATDHLSPCGVPGTSQYYGNRWQEHSPDNAHEEGSPFCLQKLRMRSWPPSQRKTKTIGNRKRDCARGCARRINTTWENLQTENHKSVRWADTGRTLGRSRSMMCLFLRIGKLSPRCWGRLGCPSASGGCSSCV